MSTDKKPNQSLVDFFPGASFVTTPGVVELRDFAAKYPEATFNDDSTVTFGTEDMQFKIRADLDFNKTPGQETVVFIGTITSFCPETVIFSTGYRRSLASVFKKLQEGWTNVDASADV